MKTKVVLMVVCLVALSWLWVTSYATEAAACKVLMVLKNSETFGMNREARRGVEKVLKDQCELKFVYLDMELNPDGVAAKVQEAYALYQTWQPDGVIAAEEDVNPLFVVPYLKDKVKTPVVFVGLISPPELYGYPASNVTGAVNRPFFKESLNFIQQLSPSVKTLGLACNDDQAARSGIPYIRKLYEDMGMTCLAPLLSNDHDAMLAWVNEQKDKIDALFVCPLLGEKTVGDIVDALQKPTFTCWRAGIEYRVMAGVIESGEEIGQLGAEMLLKAMNGTPISDLPISAPEFGQRVINVNTLKALGLEPSRRLLTGVELIK